MSNDYIVSPHAKFIFSTYIGLFSILITILTIFTHSYNVIYYFTSISIIICLLCIIIDSSVARHKENKHCNNKINNNLKNSPTLNIRSQKNSFNTEYNVNVINNIIYNQQPNIKQGGINNDKIQP